MVGSCNKDPNLDATFEAACIAAAGIPAVPDSTFPSEVSANERYELHCIAESEPFVPDDLHTELQLSEKEELGQLGLRLQDCPDPAGGAFKGRVIKTPGVRYELRRIIGISFNEETLPKTEVLPKEQASFCLFVCLFVSNCVR